MAFATASRWVPHSCNSFFLRGRSIVPAGHIAALRNARVGGLGSQSWGIALSSALFPQVRSLVRRMAASKTSKGKSRSKDLKISKCHRAFEGTVFRCSHYSESLGLDARFSVYVPDAPGIQTTLPYPRDCEEFPVLLFLSDEGCSDLEILMQGNVLQHCSDCGLILVSADTTPRTEADSVINPSYYVNATLKPWDKHCRMLDYLECDLLDIVHDNFPTCGHEAVSVMGHGMGGTSALTMAFRNAAGVPFRSVSALAPLLNPTSTEVTKKLPTSKLQVFAFCKCQSIVKCFFDILRLSRDAP